METHHPETVSDEKCYLHNRSTRHLQCFDCYCVSFSFKVEFRSGDFFKFSDKEEGKFDVILDYTFLW